VFSILESTTMVGRKRGDNPKSLAPGPDRFEAWRQSRKVGAWIPDKLWSLAVTLAELHGVSAPERCHRGKTTARISSWISAIGWRPPNDAATACTTRFEPARGRQWLRHD
jgi:hypothetical protein